MDKAQRKSKILVAVVDVKKVAAAIAEELNKLDPGKLPPEATLTIQGGLGFVKTAKGTFFLDTEGTGCNKPVEKEPLEVYLIRDDIIAIMPCAENVFTADEAMALPVLPEKVNLGTFIRTFGHRLEANFNEWQHHLTQCQPLPEFMES
jgi:hypothetical protein